MCVKACDQCATVYVYRSKGNLQCSSSASALFEISSLVISCCICQATWTMSFLGFSSLHLPPHFRSTGIAELSPCIQICMGSTDPPTGPQACTVSTFPTDPSLLPETCIKIFNAMSFDRYRHKNTIIRNIWNIA